MPTLTRNADVVACTQWLSHYSLTADNQGYTGMYTSSVCERFKWPERNILSDLSDIQPPSLQQTMGCAQNFLTCIVSIAA